MSEDEEDTQNRKKYGGAEKTIKIRVKDYEIVKRCNTCWWCGILCCKEVQTQTDYIINIWEIHTNL